MTRTIEECQKLTALWNQGKKEAVIQELGGEPTPKFLKDFKDFKPLTKTSLPVADTPPRKTSTGSSLKPGKPKGSTPD